jgi:hypothetical protein
MLQFLIIIFEDNYISLFGSSVVDPKVFITDLDPTFQSSGSGSYLKKFLVSEPTFSLMKYDFKGSKMAFQSIPFKEYLNLKHKNGQSYEITPFFDGFC